MSRRQEAVLSEGAQPPPLRCPLLCVSILLFTFFSLLFVTSTSLPQQFRSSFPEVFVPQDATWVAKTPVRFSAASCTLDQSVRTNVRFPLSKACPDLKDLEAQDSSQLER